MHSISVATSTIVSTLSFMQGRECHHRITSACIALSINYIAAVSTTASSTDFAKKRKNNNNNHNNNNN